MLEFGLGLTSLLTPVLLIAQAFELNLFGKSVIDSYVRFEIGHDYRSIRRCAVRLAARAVCRIVTRRPYGAEV